MKKYIYYTSLSLYSIEASLSPWGASSFLRSVRSPVWSLTNLTRTSRASLTPITQIHRTERLIPIVHRSPIIYVKFHGARPHGVSATTTIYRRPHTVSTTYTTTDRTKTNVPHSIHIHTHTHTHKQTPLYMVD